MKKLLLHSCCAPCSVAVIDELKDQYDLTVYFYNPNIHPTEEYEKRKAEVTRVCREWGVKMIDEDYEAEKWHEAIKGLEQEPEGGKRCAVCFAMRLHRAAEYAKKHKFDVFATTLTSGRNKLVEIIHPIAHEAAKKHDLEFLDEDWKKGGRQESGRKIIEKMAIFKQNYCGCRYTQHEQLRKDEIE